MNTEDSDNIDQYISQLEDVFDSCDIYNRGCLSRDELLTLCHKLQLDNQAEIIVDCLLKNVGSPEIAFDQFRNIFMKIVCHTSEQKVESDEHYREEESLDSDIADIDSVNEQTNEDIIINGNKENKQRKMEKTNRQKPPAKKKEVQPEVPPRYVKGEKKYGRKSRPLRSSDFKTEGHQSPETKKSVSKVTHSKKKSQIPKKTTAASKDNERDINPKVAKLDNLNEELSSEEDVEKEMFEAEGQLNLTLSELEQAQGMDNEVDYLRNIWKTLEVGQNGYITVDELERVCDHIGMEKMNAEQLQQLYDKLDLNKDGRVTFEEFIGGTTTHASPIVTGTTPRVMTPRSSSAQKKIRVPPAAEDRTTPSIIQGIGASGLFSVLDPDHTGFAMPENVIDLWEKYNVTNGTDILLALEFDLVTKVNLSELSFTLEQVMLGADDQNAVYQAAFASYQQEIRHLKSVVEQQLWAMDKLKLDLTEANARNAMLAKEVDERHLHIEQNTEKRLTLIDKKYQEQVKSLQSDLENERQRNSAQSAQYKSQLQAKMDEIKQEEVKVKENLLLAQKDIERLETDNMDISEKLSESEKANNRLQKHLENFNDIQRKLDEYETAGILSPEQLTFTQEKLVKTEGENKILKDINDELTAEVESLKQQIVSNNTLQAFSSTPSDFKSKIPVKTRSSLTDDTKAKRRAKSFVSSENSDDDDAFIPTITGRIHRRLPVAPEDDDVCSVSSLQSDSDYIEILKKVITDMKIQNEREKNDLEHTHKKKLMKMEEKLEQERKNWQSQHKQIQEQILQKHEEDVRSAFIESQKKMKDEFVTETKKIQETHEAEIKMLKEEFMVEKQHIIDNLQVEFRKELEAQISDVKKEKEHEKSQLIQNLSYPVEEYKDLLKEKCELEEQMTQQREMMKKQLLKEKADMEGEIIQQRELMKKQSLQEKSGLEEQMIQQREAMKKQFEQEVAKLKEEREIVIVNSEKAIAKLEKEKSDLSMEMKIKSENMQSKFIHDKKELQRNFEQDLQKIEEKSQQALQQYELKVDKERHREEITETLKENVGNLQRKNKTMEESFLKERDDLCTNFDKEKNYLTQKYECQIQYLQQQLKDLHDQMAEEKNKSDQRLIDERTALEEEIAKAAVKEFEEKLMSLQLEKERLEAELQKINNKNLDNLKRNLLVVDLYKENADLMEALHLTEVRKKDAVSKCYKLEERCKDLRVMLKKVSHIAVT